MDEIELIMKILAAKSEARQPLNGDTTARCNLVLE